MRHLQDYQYHCEYCGKLVISDNDCPCLQRREPEGVVLLVAWVVFLGMCGVLVGMLIRLVF